MGLACPLYNPSLKEITPDCFSSSLARNIQTPVKIQAVCCCCFMLIDSLNTLLLVVVGEKTLIQERVLLGHHIILRSALGNLGAEICSDNGDKSAKPPSQSRVSSLKTPRVKETRQGWAQSTAQAGS